MYTMYLPPVPTVEMQIVSLDEDIFFNNEPEDTRFWYTIFEKLNKLSDDMQLNFSFSSRKNRTNNLVINGKVYGIKVFLSV